MFNQPCVPSESRPLAWYKDSEDADLKDNNLRGVASLFNGVYSDFEVKCEDQTWKVHRAILGMRSTFFAKCFENFKESTTGEVELKEIVGGPKIVEAALRCVYTASYPRPPPLQRFSFQIKMFIFADRHGISDLAQSAMSRYKGYCETVKFDSFSTAQDFTTAIELIETACPTGNAMRLDSLKMAMRCAKHLFGESQDAQMFQTRLADLPLFSVELCKMLVLASETAATAPQIVASPAAGKLTFGALSLHDSAPRTAPTGSLFGGSHAPVPTPFGMIYPAARPNETSLGR